MSGLQIGSLFCRLLLFYLSNSLAEARHLHELEKGRAGESDSLDEIIDTSPIQGRVFGSTDYCFFSIADQTAVEA